MDVLQWVLLLSLPAVGLFILWLVLDRWGRKHDPMKPTRFEYWTPGSAGRRRSSLDD